MDLSKLSKIELIELRGQIDNALDKMKGEGLVFHILDDSRKKERDTIASFWKVFPKGIEKLSGRYYATSPESIRWAREMAEKYGWELIESEKEEYEFIKKIDKTFKPLCVAPKSPKPRIN